MLHRPPIDGTIDRTIDGTIDGTIDVGHWQDDGIMSVRLLVNYQFFHLY